jgi:hypothetical protein
VLAIPSAAGFRHHVDAVVPQSQARVRTFHQMLGESLSRRTQLTLLVAGTRHRLDAMLPQGERLFRAFRQLHGSLSPRKAILMLVAAGLVGLALIIVLLEVSMSKELAKEHTGAGIVAIPIPSTSPDRTDFDDAFGIQPTSPAASEFVDRVSTPRAIPIPDHAETFGQISREPAIMSAARQPMRIALMSGTLLWTSASFSNPLLPSQERPDFFNVGICRDREVLSALKTAAVSTLRTQVIIAKGKGPEWSGYQPEDIHLEAVSLSSDKKNAVFCSITISAKGITERIIYVVGTTSDSWLVKFGGGSASGMGGHRLFPEGPITVEPNGTLSAK